MLCKYCDKSLLLYLTAVLFLPQVISAQQLPKINTDNPNSIVDPQVWVEIHGVSIDKARAKTQRIDNNGEATEIFSYLK